jgi:hypothetical protein
MNFVFDEVDREIMKKRVAAREMIDGPRIGDYVIFPSGEIERFSHDWDGSLQTSPAEVGSFYLGDSGMASFSGGLNPPIGAETLSLTEKKMDGDFWFFHHGIMGAHRGVHFQAPCRVYSTTAEHHGCLRGNAFVNRGKEIVRG